MRKMLFTEQQPDVSVKVLPDGKRDVIILTDEEVVVLENLGSSEVSAKIQMFQYNGNQFRTVYEVTEGIIRGDLNKYLNYSSENEPTLDEIKKEREIIDSYTLELMEGGLL